MARPAGLSSDEDYSDDGFTFGDSPTVPRRHFIQQRPMPQSVPAIAEDLRLINAVIDNNLEEVRRLVTEEELDPNLQPQCSPQWTAVHHACSLAYVDILRFLLDDGKADPNINSQFFTPLMAVVDSIVEDEEPLLECLEMLVAKGAEVDSTDKTVKNVLILAVIRGHMRIAQRLIELCPKLVDMVCLANRTALFYAIEVGNIEMIILLKEAGANLNHVDYQNMNPYDFARSQGMKEIATLVSSYERPPELEDVIKRDPMMSSYACTLAELPDKKKGRFFGFSTDALKIVNGIGLAYLLDLFSEKNVQLGELLTNGDEDWLRLGVSMSFDRRKLVYSVRKFHERYWGKLSLGSPATIETDSLSLFNLAKFIANATRQMHIIASSTYYWNKFRNREWVVKDIKVFVAKGLGHLHILEQEIETIYNIIDEIEREKNIVPADLIRPQHHTQNRNRALKFVAAFGLGALMIYGVYCNGPKMIRRMY